ncbi:MAG: DUF2493 domain-containing protein [Caulobacter sp.]|nr:DUF2493 domain-containing protein [Caulobacter sp.]
MALDPRFETPEPPHALSATACALDALARFGSPPLDAESDPRPPADPHALAGAMADVFDALTASTSDTRLEPLLSELLWSAVDLFHRATDRLQRRLDDNEDAQKLSQQRQDGSEVASVELERLLAEGQRLLDQRDGLETLRDAAAAEFLRHTGTGWTPKAGSRVNRATLTAAMIDSRDFLAAQRRADAQVFLPPGPKIAFTGGPACNDHVRIWEALDRTLAKHPDMTLLHGGAPTGAERIAACWAESRQVTHIAFKPDWTRHAKAAPFKRNDVLLETLPIGVLVFPGSGIQANLADKARKLGIPVWRFDGGA